jgi:hypothetical protein
MELVRRLSALIIALSLALPQRSCVSGGTTEIHYPLSNFDSYLSVIVIAALYSLPLLVLLFFRFRRSSLMVGILSVAAGLYVISYGASVVADKLLIGWYTYTFAAVVYFYVSLMLLKRALSPRVSPKVDGARVDLKVDLK